MYSLYGLMEEVEELENFRKELNSFHDHIKFTFDSNKENINFLDVNIKKTQIQSLH